MCYFLYLEIARRTCRIRENVHDVCIDKQNSGPRISLEFQLVCDWMAERSFRNAVSLVSSIFPSTKRSQLKKKKGRRGGNSLVTKNREKLNNRRFKVTGDESGAGRSIHGRFDPNTLP